ncbi:MAG: tyrosine-protein kinase [Actinomycetota bacterium]|nr:tyrosine-protein kinase [Actinomycetota bacterium]
MHLRDYVAVLRRRKWLLVAAVLVVAGSAFGVSSLQDKVYEGRARIVLQADTSLFDQSDQYLPNLVPTEIQIIQSVPVAELVREALGRRVPRVAALQVGSTAVMELRVRDTSGPRAAAAVDAYGDAYIEYRRTQVVTNLLDAVKQVQIRIDSVSKEISDLDAQNQDPVVDRTDPEREALVSQRSAYKQKLDELEINKSLMKNLASFVSRASVPKAPVSPRPRQNAILGGVIGLVLGAGLIFLFEHLDDSIKTKDDLERAVLGVAVLGMIPQIDGWKAKAGPKVVSRTDPRSPPAEAYRGLRTSIRFVGLDRSLRVLQVTSASASEGKSTTVANLAVALSRAGERVAVVCCDLRRPRIHEFFGLSNAVGLTTVLLGEAPLSKAMQVVPGEKKLYVLASGAPPPNPSELLSSPRCAEVLRALSDQFDIVLVDTPPVLPVTDAVVVSARVDGVLLVAAGGSSTGKQVTRAAELLRQVGAPLVGTVLNNAFAEGDLGYGYGYGYTSTPTVENGSAHTNGKKSPPPQPLRPQAGTKQDAKPEAK